MSQFADIVSTQNRIEETVARRLDELQAQIQNAGSSKDTVAKVAEELRTFKELGFGIFQLLRQQIMECSQQIDTIETRNRRKALVLSGLEECSNEDCSQAVVHAIRKNLAVEFSAASMKSCHRIGSPSKDRPRPILIRFVNHDIKSTIWKAKAGFKGSSLSVKEFLTRSRQAIFLKARVHFGMRGCWTQDGTIVVKTSDGARHKITNEEELTLLVSKHPKKPQGSSTGAKDGEKSGR